MADLITYYCENVDERASMLREIGVHHPAVRYIEAMEKYIKQLEKDCEDYQQEVTDAIVRSW